MIKKDFFLLCVFFVFLAHNAYGQNCLCKLSGSISDLHNEAPIGFVAVQLKEVDRTVFSDSLGHYSFSGLCPGKYTLICSNIQGFKAIVKSIDILENKVVNLMY